MNRTLIQRVSIAATICCAAMLLAPDASAQIDPGRLTGTLVDENGEPLKGAELRLVPQERGAAQPMTIKVNRKGKFTVAFLPAGRWKVESVDGALFLKSMKYMHRANGLKTGDFEANGHPTEGLPSFTVSVGAHGQLDLVAGSAEGRDRLVKQIKLQEVAGPLKKAVKLYEDNDLQGVVDETDGILEGAPELEQARYLRGSALWQLGRLEEAISDLQTAMEADPELPQIRGILATALLERAAEVGKGGDEAAALTMYGDAADLLAIEAERAPDDISIKQNLVVALDSAERDEEMLPALEAIVAARPDDAAMATRLAALYASMGRHDDAMKLTETVGIDGAATGDALYNAAVEHYNESRYNQANELAAKALAVSPDHAMTHRLVGYLRLNAGDREGAVEHLKSFLKLAPEGTDTSAESGLIQTLEQQLGGS